ncbi:MAG TPA: hypothetical protein VLG69_04255, partial [Candidatus Andersenbacteria bacterium]|nr:hypothetical protein [Candidatus Andersenbacteria bacterium]
MAVIDEHARRAQLNADRNRMEARAARLSPRQNVIENTADEQAVDEAQREYAHRSNLALLKASAQQGFKKADEKAGAIAGASIGGWVGSIIPFIGTTIGAFVGRYFGKKIGATGIITFSLTAVFFIVLALIFLFIIFFKGYCETWTGWATDKITLGMCQSIGSLTNVK